MVRPFDTALKSSEQNAGQTRGSCLPCLCPCLRLASVLASVGGNVAPRTAAPRQGVESAYLRRPRGVYGSFYKLAVLFVASLY